MADVSPIKNSDAEAFHTETIENAKEEAIHILDNPKRQIFFAKKVFEHNS